MPFIIRDLILLVNSDTIDNEEDVLEVVESYCKYYQMRSRNLKVDRMDMVLKAE